jgi:CRP/FNR family transcriptional regulator, cyclic AMP receptor protein
MDADALRQIGLFSGLTSNHLAALADITEDREVPAGTALFREGDRGDELFMLLKGKVRISKQVEGVGEEALAILEPGAFFGEMALVNELPRSADAVCNTPCTVGVIRREPFEELLFLHKDLAYELLWTFVRTLSERLDQTNDKIKAFFAMSARF